ncbi:JAB domain-containing protein [Variovorax sp.]|jgi:DNA repair protein RadC|uniref:JAB domain-containing protein n=1 Tax=Variovorax sp. TaxID=1871043 RepID=UPI0037DA0136
MSQFSLSFDSSSDASLLVRDAHGHYQVATTDQILRAARQVVDQKLQRGAEFTSPVSVKEYLCAKLGGLDHEVFSVLLLDSQNRLIEYVEMFQGTISQASVYPREVVKLALKHNAAAMILSHCHPSGCAQPSRADEVLTRQLTEALKLVDVRVLDHIIVAGNATLSMAEAGLM